MLSEFCLLTGASEDSIKQRWTRCQERVLKYAPLEQKKLWRCCYMKCALLMESVKVCFHSSLFCGIYQDQDWLCCIVIQLFDFFVSWKNGCVYHFATDGIPKYTREGTSHFNCDWGGFVIGRAGASPPSCTTSAHVSYVCRTDLTVNSHHFSYFMFRARAQSLTMRLPLALRFGFGRSISFWESRYAQLRFASREQAHFRPRWRDVPCTDNVPAIIAPGRVPSKGRSTCLGIVPLSFNVLWTDMLLKPSRRVECLFRHRGVQQ